MAGGMAPGHGPHGRAGPPVRPGITFLDTGNPPYILAALALQKHLGRQVVYLGGSRMANSSYSVEGEPVGSVPINMQVFDGKEGEEWEDDDDWDDEDDDEELEDEDLEDEEWEEWEDGDDDVSDRLPSRPG